MKEVLALTFKGGKRLQNTIAATAGNIITNLSPATGKRWLVLRGKITIVNDATVADRVIAIEITDGTVLTESIGYSAAIQASETGKLDFGEARNIGGNDASVLGDLLGNVRSYIGIDPILIEEADQFRITIVNGVAGDSYSGYVVVREL